VEQQAGHEQIVREPPTAYCGDDQPGGHEGRAKDGNATIGRFANVCEDGVGPSMLAFL
jgi:hypothetical protein